ncbi:calcium and integrin binding family member 2, partial [Homo sapiens]
APNLVPMDYRKSPIVHVPMSLIIQMPELRMGKPRLRGIWSLLQGHTGCPQSGSGALLLILHPQ